MNEIEDLKAEIESLERQMDDFFDDDETPYYGDQGYQDLASELSELEDRLERLQKQI